MSQIGKEGIIESAESTNVSHYVSKPSDVILLHSAAAVDMPQVAAYDDLYSTERSMVLLIFSVIGLLGNFLTILLVISLRRLQLPKNSFFVHHCILDTVKSAYCIAFSKSLFNKEPPADCAILGASYIVFVTTSAFNILAITINEMYHFTNEIVGIQPGNKCCVVFGIVITWFASIIINLGVAFLPSNPTFDRTVGYCTFMYGVTGNYLLHVLWIVLITIALLLTAIYLRKYWIDIKDRMRYRIATLFQQTVQMQMHIHQINDNKCFVDKAVTVAKKNFYLMTAMIVAFLLFWYPLFILTLSDPHFRANPIFYKTLTIVSWCHSSLTPLFFTIYNTSSFRTTKSRSSTDNETMVEESSHSSTKHPPASESGSTPRSPQRPNSLKVTPAYHCHHHRSSGPCITDEYDRPSSKASSTMTKLVRRTVSCVTEDQQMFTGNSTSGKIGQPLLKFSINDTKKIKQYNKIPFQKSRSEPFNIEEKFHKMGSVLSSEHDRKSRLQVMESTLSASAINDLIHRSHTKVINEHTACEVADDTLLVQGTLTSREKAVHNNYLTNYDTHQTPIWRSITGRSATVPNDLCRNLNNLLTVDESGEQTIPSPCVVVHDATSNFVTLPVHIYNRQSDLRVYGKSKEWV